MVVLKKGNHVKLFLAVALAFGLLPTPNFAVEKPLSVVELFTSQGCSSCPAADQLAAELALDPKLIVLSYSVDYWDYLGWKDTLASHEFTERQRAYSVQRGDKQVYTPQVIVNGGNHAVGSERAEITKLTTKNNLLIPLEIIHARDGHKVNVSALAGSSATLIMLPVTRSKTVAIGRGENHGRTITYTNIIRGIVKLGEWTGEAKSFDLPTIPKEFSDADGFVVVLQKGSISKPGSIIGAVKGSGF
jgi:hypothetical protein